MTMNFGDIRPAVESSRLSGAPSGIRRSQTLLDPGSDGSTESHFGLPSARAETGALLERQLLISGGLEDRRLAPTLGRGSRLPTLVLGLCVVALAGAGCALYVHYQNARDQWREEMSARSGELATARADNDRLLLERRETERRLEATTDELAKETSERRRVAEQAEKVRGELKDARQKAVELRHEIDDLNTRYAKLERERLAEVGAFLEAWLRSPLERVRSLSKAAASPGAVSSSLGSSSAGPLPRAAPLVESPAPEKTER